MDIDYDSTESYSNNCMNFKFEELINVIIIIIHHVFNHFFLLLIHNYIFLLLFYEIFMVLNLYF